VSDAVESGAVRDPDLRECRELRAQIGLEALRALGQKARDEAVVDLAEELPPKALRALEEAPLRGSG